MRLARLAPPPAGALALAAAMAVGLAYQVQLPVEMPAGGPLSLVGFEGFYPSEGSHRWSRGRGRIVFRDPGPGVRARVEADIAGWRPRAQPPPHVVLEAGGARIEAPPSRQGQTVTLTVVTGGWWSSDLDLSVQSETFRPGPRDPRPLGVRVQSVRFVPEGPILWPRRPPLGAPLVAALTVLLSCGALLRMGTSPERVRLLGLSLVAALGLGYMFARPYVAWLSLPLLAAAIVLALAAHVAAPAVRVVAQAAAASVRAWVRGARSAALGWPALALMLAATVAVVVAHRARPVLDVDVGSGREGGVARNLGAFDSAGGATFRQAMRGSALDLRDFGSGNWSVAVTAAAGGERRSLVVARAGDSEAEAVLGEGWTTTLLRARAPWGWRAGLPLEFPAGSDSSDLRIDRVRIQRDASWPSARLVALVIAAALLAGLALGAVGLPSSACAVAGTAVVVGETLALALDPVVTIPFAATFCAIAALGSALAAALAGAALVARERARAVVPAPAALAAAAVGFVAFFTTTAFPLYRGGHFGFHSQIAEQIWQGRFLLYYLPYPGSMLSRQAQWGDIIVPHPALFHTLVAPLAALPDTWFALAVKLVLATWLAGIVLVAAVLATAAGGPSAGAWTGVLAAGLVPSYQLLGLGHLMTILGCFAMAAAMGYLILRFDMLPQRRTWLAAVALLSLCFLAYTAGLLFAAFAIAAALPFVVRSEPSTARALAAAGLAAAAVAFLLYYMYWTWPFLSQSVPRILHGSGAPEGGGTPVFRRLLALPHKLNYSYGSALIPVLGLAGLVRARTLRGWPLLAAWAAVLPVFSVADLFFNLLLKHHYFTAVPVAVGGGLLLAALARRGPVGRVSAGVLLGLALLLGLQTALDAALGRIP
ncbi:MAG TPA: hypothetical protein VGN09_05120 [Vicinamibacteria bacterium]|jgi:hypothetical protein